jgi:mannose-1-phosphate guanylyltransferase
MAATTDHKITPVILAGGPQGREHLLAHRNASRQCLLHQAIESIADDRIFTSPVIAGNAADEDVLRVELDVAGIEPAAVILARNWPGDAGALVMSTMLAASLGYRGAVLALPLDRPIPDAESLSAAITQARPALQLGAYASFGLEPGAVPEATNYFVTGNPIMTGAEAAEDPPKLFTVADFATAAEAQLLSADNGAFADTGIHILPMTELLKDLRLSGSRLFSACQTVLTAAIIDQCFVRTGEFALEATKSIAETLLARSPRNIVVAVSSFLPAASAGEEWDIIPQDGAQNITSGDIILQDVSGAYVHSTGPITAVAGLDNVVVVNLGAAVIVTSKSHMPNIRHMADAIRQQLQIKAAKTTRQEAAQNIANAVATARPAPEPQAFVLQRAAS